MATHFVDSGASGANNGSSWADSYTSITSVSPAAGDVIYLAATHDESLSGTSYLGGTVSAPVWIVSATAGSDPVSYASGATLRAWTSSALIRPGSGGKFVVWWGVSLLADGAGHQDLKLAMNDDSGSYFFDCTLKAMDQLYLTSSNDSYAKFTGCSMEILAAASSGGRYLYQTGIATTVDVRDGTVVNPHRDYAFRKFYGATSRFRACDLSSFDELHNDGSHSRSGSVQFSGWSAGSGFSLGTTDYARKVGSVTAADYCDAGTFSASDAVNGFTGANDYYGKTAFDSARYRSNGARDSLTGDNYSHAITGQYGSLAEGHNSCELVTRVDGGSSVVVTLHLAASGALYDDEMWVDFFGPSESSSARQYFHTTRKANPTVTRAELAADTEGWIGSGVGTKHRISVTFTPHHPGLCHVIPVYAKGSGSIYVCPQLTVD